MVHSVKGLGVNSTIFQVNIYAGDPILSEYVFRIKTSCDHLLSEYRKPEHCLLLRLICLSKGKALSAGCRA